MTGIKEELEEVGIQTIGSEDYYQTIEKDIEKYVEFEIDPEVGAVVMGIDYNFNYKKLSVARYYFLQNNAEMVATNKDLVYNFKDKIMPGGGSLIAAVEACTKEFTLVGKPSHFPLEHILNEQVGKKDCIMIGDNIDTDILFGVKNEIDTGLVMTGVTDLKLLEKKKEEGAKMPTYFMENLSLI